MDELNPMEVVVPAEDSALARARAEKLGELYEELIRVLMVREAMDGVMKAELSKLCDRYTHANVAWMMHVIKEDLAQ